MPLKLFTRGTSKIWHYRGQVAGRRIRGTTGTSNRDIAQRLAAEAEVRAHKYYTDGPETILTFADAAITYRKAGKPTRFLKKVENYWRDTLLKDITTGAIKQAALDLYPNVSGATRNRQGIIPMQAIINHAADLGMCPHIRVRRFKVETKIKKPVTDEWIRAFVRVANPHIGALALFMYMTGARVSEAIALRWTDVDLKRRTALIRQTKIGTERLANLPQQLVVALGNLPKDDRGVFFYVTRGAALNAWKLAAKKARIEPLSFHSCRHGAATKALHSGIDPITTAKLFGWKSADHVFKTYGHAKDDPRLTDAIFDTAGTQPTVQRSRKPYKTGTT